jgi:hypothetical protein
MTGRAGTIRAVRVRLGPGLSAPLAASVALLLFACCLLLLVLTRDYRQALYGGGGTVTALVSAAVGLVVARRQPRNPIGWLLLGWALLVPVVGVALLYSVLDYRIRHGALPAGQVAVVAQAAAFLVAAASGLAVLLFPDGALASRWWRGVALAFLACCALFAVHQFVDQAAAAGARPVRVDWTGAPLASRAPAGAAASLARAGLAAGWLVLAGWLAFVGRQAVTFRHAAGLRRQQLKWLLAGAVSCVIATTVTIFWGGRSSGAAQAVQAAADLGAAALPVGIGIGILRYRLYEIDRVISRTLAYAIVTGLLIGLYACLTLLAAVVLPPSSPVVVAGATLVVAALFSPLRQRVQRVVDRRFNRARYDTDRMVAAFAARLKDAMDLDAVQADLASVIQQALEPAHTSVWIHTSPSTPPARGQSHDRRHSGVIRGTD